VAPVATLFDFDGVLVDSEPVHLAAFNDVLASRGVVLDGADYAANLLSLDDAGVFRAVLARGGARPGDDEVRALVEAKSPRFLERFRGAFRPFPGAEALVARRAGRGPVGIVSGALDGEIRFALARMGLTENVLFVVAAEHTLASKPDPAPYLAGIAALRQRGHAGATVVVEDSIGGVTSAKRAGLRCVAVAHSYARDELLRAGADAVAADLASLDDALLDGDGDGDVA
jgi:HAD superfamily hydrolase (TIGR01509 family)